MVNWRVDPATTHRTVMALYVYLVK